jgi:hypothetical protein
MQPPLNDLQRRARGLRGGRYSRGLPRRGDARTRLGALRSGSGCWRPSSPGDHQLLGVQGWDHGELMTMAGYAEQAEAQAASASA